MKKSRWPRKGERQTTVACCHKMSHKNLPTGFTSPPEELVQNLAKF
jgi:hypothetical protein